MWAGFSSELFAFQLGMLENRGLKFNTTHIDSHTYITLVSTHYNVSICWVFFFYLAILSCELLNCVEYKYVGMFT